MKKIFIALVFASGVIFGGLHKQRQRITPQLITDPSYNLFIRKAINCKFEEAQNVFILQDYHKAQQLYLELTLNLNLTPWEARTALVYYTRCQELIASRKQEEVPVAPPSSTPLSMSSFMEAPTKMRKPSGVQPSIKKKHPKKARILVDQRQTRLQFTDSSLSLQL